MDDEPRVGAGAVNVYIKLLGYEIARIEIDLTPAINLLNTVGPDGHRPGDKLIKRISDKWVHRMAS